MQQARPPGAPPQAPAQTVRPPAAAQVDRPFSLWPLTMRPVTLRSRAAVAADSAPVTPPLGPAAAATGAPATAPAAAGGTRLQRLLEQLTPASAAPAPAAAVPRSLVATASGTQRALDIIRATGVRLEDWSGPERLSSRWVRYSRALPPPPVMGYQDVQLWGLHATCEEGLQGIMTDLWVRCMPWALEGWQNARMACCRGFVKSAGGVAENRDELLRLLDGLQPGQSKHRVGAVAELMPIGQHLSLRHSTAWRAEDHLDKLVHFPRDRMSLWAVPEPLAEITGVWVDLAFP